MTITLYTQNQCPPCQFVKNLFIDRGLKFTEKNISNPVYRNEMIDMDAFSTPLIIINDKIIRTVDLSAIDEALKEVQA